MDWTLPWNAINVILISKYDVIEIFPKAVGRIGPTYMFGYMKS